MRDKSKQKIASDAKKKAKRDKAKKKTREKALNQSLHDKYPRFIFREYDQNTVNEEFVLAVKGVVKKFDFENQECMRPLNPEYFRMFKKYGINMTLYKLIKEMPSIDINKIYSDYNLHIGNWVFEKLRDQGVLQKFVPFNDCQFFLDKDCYIKFDAMLSSKTLSGTAYYAPKKPVVDIDGKKYIVSFSKHALDRIAARCVLDRLSYGGAGDVFAYLTHCTYYEYCTMTHDGQIVPGITFYDSCNKRFDVFQYGEELMENKDKDLKYYYRIGYCPIDVHNGYAKAITFLTPGMEGTPECSMFKKMLNAKEKEEIQESVQNTISYKRWSETKDFRAIKWFHANGVPQIMASRKELYNYE